jgi:hypothetical protein
MTKEAVNNTLNAQPFKPFSLRLTDGSRARVPHPDFIVVSQGGRTAIVNTEGEQFPLWICHWLQRLNWARQTVTEQRVVGSSINNQRADGIAL